MTRVDHRARHLERIEEVKAGNGVERVPYPIGIRETTVVRTAMVGTGLIRVTLGGPALAGFESHAHAPDEHVKLIYPEPDGTLRLPEPNGLMLNWPRPLPPAREYSVRRYDPATTELDIDIALHDGGLGAEWAKALKPGAVIHVAGPPGGKVVPFNYDRYLLAGDLTALPAIARWLEELPRDAVGWAFIEVADPGEEIELAPPDGVEVRWLHHRGTAGASEQLGAAVREVTVPEGERVFVWAAGEAQTLKPIRRWVRGDLRLGSGDVNITGYWKRGVAAYDDEDDH